MTTMCRHTR